MDSLISRQAAINVILEDKIGNENLEIMTALGHGDTSLAVNHACDRHVQSIRDLPSAQPEPQWIPCSETEELPNHEVLCCDNYGEELIGWLSCEDDQWLCESDGEMMYDPIAWRELPEPWRGES